MTDDRLLEHAARAWLEEGPTRAPDRPVDEALARIETISQERDLRILWRPNTMFDRIAVAAMTVAVAFGGITLGYSLITAPDGPAATPAVPATLAELNGPWRSEPLLIPDDVLSATEAACRRDPAFPAGLTLVVADARGTALMPAERPGSPDTVRRGALGFHGPNGQFAHCLVTEFDANPTWQRHAVLGGTSCCSPASLSAGEMRWDARPFPSFIGRAGAGIASVRIELDNGVTAIASRRGDWFAASLTGFAPGGSVGYRAVGLNASGKVVAVLDDFS